MSKLAKSSVTYVLDGPIHGELHALNKNINGTSNSQINAYHITQLLCTCNVFVFDTKMTV